MYSIKHHLKTFVSYFRHFGTIRRVFLIQTDRHDIIEFFQSIYFTIDTVSKAYDASQGVLNRRFLLLNLWFPVVTLKLSLRKFYGRHHDLVNLDTMDTFSLLYSQFRPPFLFHDSSSRFNKDNTTDVSSTERTGYLSGTHESNLVFVFVARQCFVEHYSGLFFGLFLLAIVLSATVVGETKIPSTFRSSFMAYHRVCNQNITTGCHQCSRNCLPFRST